jgi:hypothetical protein
VTFVKIRIHRRKFSNSDSVEQKNIFVIMPTDTEKYVLIMNVPNINLMLMLLLIYAYYLNNI